MKGNKIGNIGMGKMPGGVKAVNPSNKNIPDWVLPSSAPNPMNRFSIRQKPVKPNK